MPHIHELIDFTSEVFIVHKNRVLLRMHDKFKFWLSVGGHIELNEDPNEAALREVKEEVGLDVKLHGEAHQTEAAETGFKELISPVYNCRMRISPTHEHVTFVYFATCESDNIVVGYESDRSDETRWFSFEELSDPKYTLRPNVKFYAEQALKILGSSN
ncbi:MAG: NUDIX domain-containing protein [bacterium]